MASSNGRVRVVDVCRITPSLDSPASAAELSLPLTFFDTFWIKFHPVERIFFYQLSDSTPALFDSVILPKLKHSLALALLHYLPLAGSLVWPPDADKPFIFYAPNNSAVSVTIAESDADFHHLAGNGIREAVESRSYIPELPVSDTTAAVISFQATLFPNQGFCIGVSSHHAILDGHSVTMFMKAWANLCKSQSEKEKKPSLSPEQVPIIDRTIIQDPEGISMVYLNNWLEIASRVDLGHNPRSLKLLSQPPKTNRVRGTFELSREDIKKLRQKVLLHYQFDNSMHLSTFVLSYAYVAVNVLKARGLERHRKVMFAIIADCRARLDPPLPANYFGNCVSIHTAEVEPEGLMQENGLFFAVERLSEKIKRLEKGALEGAKEKISTFMAIKPGSIEAIGTAGSPRFGVYSTDFGWGRPKKVEITSIDRSTGTISLAESRDGTGGVEVGVVLAKHEMEMFDSLFVNGLKDV
ncbi:phenolic glucoside malonyltransferase 1 [Ricinus communis]|uniref:Anthocyanin 5-aromatic acyltransferase, putative n=1 Tax=Ricinus communis TaxID=3988 RepID=B9SNQ3_RICCO|nr:phenolic glucoside malonyltransferase 1 [Ricinus communis]EEF34761.1 Anthocyanin 5-aromatic acyltransferase, putative [Ricinus communis]|eukprot:XP_002527622.1 phenolic glucoside malonyltransferase 1 [Ricinus communis]